jgi:hypothetical protein
MIIVPSSGNVERFGGRYWKIGAALILPIVVTVLVALLKTPAPHGLENGSFENDCCGSLRLRDGDLLLNDQPATHYTVGQDARGAYVLPSRYVGGLDGIGFEIDGARPVTKLRLDRVPNPTSLLLRGDGKTYMFKKRQVNLSNQQRR